MFIYWLCLPVGEIKEGGLHGCGIAVGWYDMVSLQQLCMDNVTYVHSGMLYSPMGILRPFFLYCIY